jgi:hypothetical protein
VNMAQSFPDLLNVAKRFSHITSIKTVDYSHSRLHYRYAAFSYVCLKYGIRIIIAAPHDDETVGRISDLATLIK